MKAEDTVMTSEQIAHAIRQAGARGFPNPNFSQIITRAQAEISFKAGIKEIVEWIEDNSEYYQCGTCDYDRHIKDKLWQSKLKEWGLE